MTPERIEEIEFWYRVAEKGQLIKYVHDLLTALEETQQQLTLERERTDYWGEKELEVRKKLEEAQQTISRQKEALQAVYENSDDIGARQCVAEALGITWEDETNG